MENKKTKKVLLIVFLAVLGFVLTILVIGFFFSKIINISNKKGDSVKKFRKAYTAGIEVPDDAEDLRFKSNTFWWAGHAEVAFSLEEDEFEDYLEKIGENYVLKDWETDYGVAGMKVSDAALTLPNIDYDYMMIDSVDDYEIIFYKKETETEIIILASGEDGRIYYYISAGG